MSKFFEYAAMEWIWNVAQITTYMPGNKVFKISGSYPEIVIELNKLGQEGWEISSCTSSGNWIFWTFKKETTPAQGNRP
jgi:hypothetical protein